MTPTVRFFVATESSKYLLIFVLYVCVIFLFLLWEFLEQVYLKDMLAFVVYLK
jgi:hypothetical protein